MGAPSQENFDKVRDLSLTFLKAIRVEASRLNILSSPRAGFDTHVSKLRGLESKLIGASKPNLQREDFDIMGNFRDRILGHPKSGYKFAQHYQIAVEYANAAYSTNNIEIIPKIMNAVIRYGDVDNLTDDIYVELLRNLEVRRAKNKPNDIHILDITGSMILWIAKRETLSYVIKGIFEEAKEKLDLSGYDLDQILSLEDKVENQSDKKTGAITGYITDVEAIRLCIAHGRYRIRKDNKVGYMLEFDWEQKHGRNFRRCYTAFDFLGLTEKYIFFEEMQATLLIIPMCECLMVLYLLKN